MRHLVRIDNDIGTLADPKEIITMNITHKCPRASRSTSAFTLIELLVVIAIIAILAAILFPVFGRARENARRSSCLSNMKQIGLSMYQYAQDYDERIPTGLAADVPVGWGSQSYPYVKSGQVFRCPSDTTRLSAALTPIFTDVVSYGYNSGIGWNNTPRGTAGFIPSYQATAKTILLFETMNTPALPLQNLETGLQSFKSPTGNGMGGRLFTNTGGIRGLYMTGAMGGRPATIEAPTEIINSSTAGNGNFGSATGRHLDGSVFLFLDGHAKWLKGERVSSGDPAPTADAPQGGTSSAYAAGTSTAAGTNVDTFQATFSPI